MTESLADGPDWRLWSWTAVWLSLTHEVILINQDLTLADKVLKKTPLDLSKTFPNMCPKHLAALLRFQRTAYSGIGRGGNDTGRLARWEFPLWIDSASWNSFEYAIHFICNSCVRPESSKIVFWSSTNFWSPNHIWGRTGISAILPFLQDFIDELHEIPISVAIIVLAGVGALLRIELLGNHDDRLFRDIPL